jgi:hypothetical protein
MAVEKKYIKLVNFGLKLKQAHTNKCRYLVWLKLQIFQNHLNKLKR